MYVDASLSFASCSSKLLKLSGFVGNPDLVAKMDRSMGTLGTHHLQLVSEVRAVL